MDDLEFQGSSKQACLTSAVLFFVLFWAMLALVGGFSIRFLWVAFTSSHAAILIRLLLFLASLVGIRRLARGACAPEVYPHERAFSNEFPYLDALIGSAEMDVGVSKPRFLRFLPDFDLSIVRLRRSQVSGAILGGALFLILSDEDLSTALGLEFVAADLSRSSHCFAIGAG